MRRGGGGSKCVDALKHTLAHAHRHKEAHTHAHTQDVLVTR